MQLQSTFVRLRQRQDARSISRGLKMRGAGLAALFPDPPLGGKLHLEDDDTGYRVDTVREHWENREKLEMSRGMKKNSGKNC